MIKDLFFEIDDKISKTVKIWSKIIKDKSTLVIAYIINLYENFVLNEDN